MSTLLTYVVMGLSFNSSIQLSNPETVGLNAIQFAYPVNVESDKTELQIIFVNFDVESQNNMKMSDAELISYVKTTFLGTGKQGENIKERQILGNTSKGEILKTKIPIASNIEIHFINLPDSTKIAIAFKSVNTIDADVLEGITSEITGSLKMK